MFLITFSDYIIVILALLLCALMLGDGVLNMTRYGRQFFAFLGLCDQGEKLTFLQRKN